MIFQRMLLGFNIIIDDDDGVKISVIKTLKKFISAIASKMSLKMKCFIYNDKCDVIKMTSEKKRFVAIFLKRFSNNFQAI